MKKIALFVALAFAGLQGLTASGFNCKINRENVTEVCDAVSRWQIANHCYIRRNTLDWTNGAMFRGLLAWDDAKGTNDAYMYLYGIGEDNGWNLHNCPEQGRYHADDLCITQAYVELYRKFGNPLMTAPARERLFYIASHPSTAPLRKDDPVGKDERWSWCDALFMAAPAFAALYQLTGETVYAEYLENEFWACTDSLYDKDDRLYYRDCTMIPKREPNGCKMFWSRGNGWVAGAIPLVLENLPADYPYREKYIALFKDLMSSVIKCQDKNGSWHASMLDHQNYTVPENSASAFFCYALAWGINNGVLTGKEYRMALEKGWAALVSYVSPEGKIGYVQQIGHAPVTVKAEETENYAVGAFLLAGRELIKSLSK